MFANRIALLCILILLGCGYIHAESKISQIEGYLDKQVPEMLSKERVPGLVLALVLGDEVVLRGYGVASVETQEPMDPYLTCVPVASISKLITATAVMQLYEQGKIQLDVDIQTYPLGFTIDNPFSTPITVHHLLTHTAGFDDQFLGMGAPDYEHVLPLGWYLARYLPRIVMPPGTAISYSNHGFALLGYIVELVSQMSFGDYVQQYIFRPLEMNNTRFDGLCADKTQRAIGYLDYWGRLHPTRLDFAQTAPASSLHTTAEDFSHFLWAILNNGRFGDNQILQSSTVDLFLTPRYKAHPLLPGYACAWEEWFLQGKRAWSHSGLTWGFSSLTFVLPEERVGVFITVNSNKNGIVYQLANELVGKFTLRTRDQDSMPAYPSIVAKEFYRKVEGCYRFNRYCRSDVFKLATFLPGFVPEVYVWGNEQERRLELLYLSYGARVWYVEELGDMFWGRRLKDGSIASSPRITFVRGNIPDKYLLVMGTNVYEPIGFIESKAMQYAIFLGSVTALLLSVIRYLIKRIFRKITQGSFPFLRRTLWISLSFLGYIGFFAVYLFLIVDLQSLGYGIPLGLFILLCIPFLLLVGTVWNWLYLITKFDKFSLDKFYMFLVLVASSFLLYLFNYWNVLDFSFSFVHRIFIDLH